MRHSELSGKAQTVLGSIDRDSLGSTIVHEHILNDVTLFFQEPVMDYEKRLAYEQVSLSNLFWVSLNPTGSLDNLLITDEKTAVDEIVIFKKAGGNTIVDVTPNVLGRDPVALARISRSTGLNIIMGTGYYIAAANPSDIIAMTEKEIVQAIVKDILVGVGDTQIRSGIIGEIGCSQPLADFERKVLRCCAVAQRQTGAPIYLHPGPTDYLLMENIQILADAGADLKRVIIGHIDVWNYSESICRELAGAGCFLGFDNFGNTGLFRTPERDRILDLSDLRRINDIIGLIDHGFGDQLLVSQDIGLKIRLTRYGGTGYAHILRDIVPLMKTLGVSDRNVNKILIDNPKRILAFD